MEVRAIAANIAETTLRRVMTGSVTVIEGASPRSAFTNSAALEKRRVGSASSARMIARSHPGSSAGTTDRGVGTGTFDRRMAAANGVSAANGSEPVTIL